MSRVHLAGIDGTRDVVPLTTIWTPPVRCPSILPFPDPTAVYASYGINVHCKPPDYDDVWWACGYYSPGVCLSWYAIGCTETTDTLNLVSIESTETVAIRVAR